MTDSVSPELVNVCDCGTTDALVCKEHPDCRPSYCKLTHQENAVLRRKVEQQPTVSTSNHQTLPKQSVELIRATLEDMRKHGLTGGLPQDHAFTLLEEIATLRTERAAWEKRAYQAEGNENRYRAALQHIVNGAVIQGMSDALFAEKVLSGDPTLPVETRAQARFGGNTGYMLRELSEIRSWVIDGETKDAASRLQCLADWLQGAPPESLEKACEHGRA